MKKTHLAAALCAGSVLGAIVAVPAYAEGSWNGSMSKVATGFSSRSWQDSAKDGTATTTTFGGCSITGNAVGFKSASITLYDERGLLPDVSMGMKTNICGSSSWGAMTRSDKYHWTVSGMNGGVDSAMRLSVTTIKQTY